MRFVACADSKLMVFDVNINDEDEQTYKIKLERTIVSHDKIVNMCNQLRATESIFACSRDPIIKLMHIG